MLASFTHLFHVAPHDARDAIQAEGLDTTVRLFEHIERPEGVYVWSELTAALWWASQCEGPKLLGPQDIWRIDAHDLTPLRDPALNSRSGGNAHAWYLPHPVPKTRLGLVPRG